MDKQADTPEFTPDPKDLEALAQCLYPAIVAYFESEEGQREFKEWKAKKAKLKGKKKNG